MTKYHWLQPTLVPQDLEIRRAYLRIHDLGEELAGATIRDSSRRDGEPLFPNGFLYSTTMCAHVLHEKAHGTIVVIHDTELDQATDDLILAPTAEKS